MTVRVRDPELDYALGWRWLVPRDGPCALETIGVPAEHAAFMRAELGSAAQRDDAVWWIDADSQDARSRANAGVPREARAVCVLGSGREVKRWRTALERAYPVVCDYALLPARSPRVVVPLRTREHAIAALRLHRPGRRGARYALELARLLRWAGITAPLTARVLCIATREELGPFGARECLLERDATSNAQSYALYLGRPDGGRKTIVLPLAAPRHSLIKIAATDESIRDLRHEIAALGALSGTEVAPHVPRCTRVVEGEGSLALFQEYRERRTVLPRTLERSAIRFLAALSRLGRQRVRLHSVLDRLGRGGGEVAARVAARLRARGDLLVYLHAAHGDFAPWNSAYTSGGVFVYDWEEFSPDGIAFGDVFHYVLAPAELVKRAGSPTRVIAGAVTLARKLAREADLDDANLEAYLALFLLQKHAQAPAPFTSLLLEALEETWTHPRV